ncbi:PAS domain S-box-containing protein [Nitrosospira sp. Nsp2]|uniref:PAS domain S-box protein n=1 Tax=Nitrosospira sp. Nsp2 TaxID=136548 RepID=UPI000D3007D4|nr:PAS domain S-box protein [Nitrosospira sp. Nsp2]PTR17225.1 PAS domain S-box-containing protein [Nitrosospira sp. Nsp2]
MKKNAETGNAKVAGSQSKLPYWLQGSEMGEVIFAHDWTNSGLGPLSTWPHHLKFAVNTMLLMPSAAMLLWGRDLLQIYNDRCRDLMGPKHSIYLGRATRESWPEVWDFTWPICEGVTQRWESFNFEDKRLVVNLNNGAPKEVFVTLTYSPVPGNIFAEISDGITIERGEAAGVLLTVTETTESVRARACEAERVRLKEELAELALRESENRFRQALEIDTVGVVFFNKQGLVTEANDAFLKMSGFSREDQKTGRLRSDDLTPREWHSTVLRAAEELKTTGRITPYERELFRKDGTRWWALVATKQLHYNEIVAYVVDISERRRIEKSLRESEARFRALAEASPALIWQVDQLGDVIYVNQRAVELMDMGVEELMAGGWRSILHPDDAPGYLAAFDKATLDRSYFKHRVRIRNREGGWRWLKTHAMPWFPSPGEYAGYVGISLDITETVNGETALLEANRRKDEFLATLAHELRNPLAPIVNALALIAQPEGIASAPRLLPIISRQVDYMVHLVDDLLEISRITSGRVELRIAPTDLVGVLRNAIDTNMDGINEKQLELSESLPQKLLIVQGDAVRLEQIFVNLLNNAIRYTPKGGHIWIDAWQEDDSAVVSVRDNGIGILPGMLPRLFEIFSQERRGGMGTQEGLGIGLSLVDRLVKMHGGTVEARSEGEDKGSEFVVRLPLRQAQASEKVQQPEKTVSAKPSLRVLVVDDNHDAAQVICMLLETMGVNVEAVDSGPAALAAIPVHRPNMILMDIGMPGMDGNEVARRIRQQSVFNDIKLVALTGWGQEKDRRRSKESGFDHHLTKPVNLPDLTKLIASI